MNSNITSLGVVEVLAVTPKVAKQVLGCGNTRLYELLKAGEIKSYRDGKARKISMASLRGYVARQLSAEPSKGKARWTERATQTRMTKGASKQRLQAGSSE